MRRAGYRVTRQRELIMDVICESRTRLSAQEICAVVRVRDASVNEATVYRNLRFLAERGLIRSLEQQGQVRYELAGPRAAHHHLVCRGCGAEREVPGDVTDDLVHRLRDRFGFSVTSDHLVFEGWCGACAASTRGEA